MKETTDTTQGGTGSSNYHSRRPASGAKRWSQCTASVGFIEENDALIFPIKVGKVIRLIPFLRSIPKEEVKDYEWRAIEIAEAIEARERTIESLTERERKDIEYTEGSVASRTGVRAHDFAEAILNGRKKLEDIPAEFHDCLKIYIDHCLSLVPEGVTPQVEVKMPLFYGDGPHDTGTIDFLVITADRIIVRDYKNGGGVEENAEFNKQMSIYSRSVAEYFDDVLEFSDDIIVDLGIVQPNHHAGSPIKTWAITLGELRAFTWDIEHAAIQIKENRGLKFAPSDEACGFCDARSFCKARQAAMNEGLDRPGRSAEDMIALLPDLSKEELAQPVAERVETVLVEVVGDEVMPLGAVRDEYLVRYYASISARQSFDKDVAEYLESRVLAGEKIEGLKLVMGNQGDRAWADETAADTFLRGQKLKEDERYNFKLKSPAQVEKIPSIKEKLKASTRTANRFAELITRAPARKKLALASDKREAVGAAIDALPVLDEPEIWEP